MVRRQKNIINKTPCLYTNRPSHMILRTEKYAGFEYDVSIVIYLNCKLFIPSFADLFLIKSQGL